MYQQQSSTLGAEHSGHALLVLVTGRSHVLQLLHLCIGGMREIAQCFPIHLLSESQVAGCAGLPVSAIGLQSVPSLLLQAHGPLEAAKREVARSQVRYLADHHAHADAHAASCARHCI